jgi:hypothetical protein
MGVC